MVEVEAEAVVAEGMVLTAVEDLLLVVVEVTGNGGRRSREVETEKRRSRSSSG